MATTRARFLMAASASFLAGCGARPALLAHSSAPVRKSNLVNENTPPDGNYCTNQSQTGCVDPASNLYVIGSVQARAAPFSVSTGWSVSGDGENPDYVGPLHRFTQRLATCAQDRTSELAATAFAMATYIQANAASLSSATSDLKTYVGVFLAGGASSFELIAAVTAVLTLGDWLVLLGAVGLTAFEVASLIRCVAEQSQ
jgi:hypothetical protein